MNRLEHKVALVDGAARGIGAAIAQAFVAEGAFVSDIDEAGGRAIADSLDAAWLKPDAREELARIGAMARVLDCHGRFDVLAKNAGFAVLVGGAAHDLEHAALPIWHAVMRTNLDGVFLGGKHALRAIRRSTQAGSIVNIASRSGRVGVPAAAAFAASKAAVVIYPRSISRRAWLNSSLTHLCDASRSLPRWRSWLCSWSATNTSP